MSNNLNKITNLELKKSVEALIKAYPASSSVIENLILYFDNKEDDRDPKRRKIQQISSDDQEVLRIVDISFQLPARKKYDLIITNTRLLLFNSKTNNIEFEYNLSSISPLGGSCVPSPDKANKSFTFILFTLEDSIVFNTQDKIDVTIKKPNTTDQQLSTDKHETICQLLTEYTHVPIAQPSKEYFKSTGVSSSTGKAEDRAHVIAYLKAKDGFLFFLPSGILFGFKKPTLFFPSSSLASTVITNITNRTFDLTLTLKQGCQVLGSSTFKPTKDGDDDTVQFSMIEQSEYEGIDGFIKKFDINDQSMSEERKAVNKEEKTHLQGERKEGKGKGKQVEIVDSEEEDQDFEPSDDDSDPLEYDSEADEEEGHEEEEGEEDQALVAEKEEEEEEEHGDAMEEDDDQLDEDSD